jgi:hypothetical protein
MTHFDSIISAYEYVTLLEQTLEEEWNEMERMLAFGNLPKRQVEYIQVVIHNMRRAEFHMKAGKRALNNLRRLENIG